MRRVPNSLFAVMVVYTVTHILMTELVRSNCKLSKLVPSPPLACLQKPVSPVLEGGTSGGRVITRSRVCKT